MNPGPEWESREVPSLPGKQVFWLAAADASQSGYANDVVSV